MGISDNVNLIFFGNFHWNIDINRHILFILDFKRRKVLEINIVKAPRGWVGILLTLPPRSDYKEIVVIDTNVEVHIIHKSGDPL